MLWLKEAALSKLPASWEGVLDFKEFREIPWKRLEKVRAK
jgi:hypothetical protein